MNIVDIIIIACLMIGAFAGYDKGFIRTILQLIGSIFIIFIAYRFKNVVAAWLMSFMPFFNYAGAFKGITAVNILVYQVVSFVVIYIVLSCILGVILNLTGIVEKILKMSIIFDIPSKILGFIVGAAEGLVFAFLLVFVAYNISYTTNLVQNSKYGVVLLERTPIVSKFTLNTTASIESIHNVLKEKEIENDTDLKNSRVLSELIHYNLISKEDATKLIETEKIYLPYVTLN